MADTLPMYAEVIDCLEAKTILDMPSPPRRVPQQSSREDTAEEDGEDDERQALYSGPRPTIRLSYRPRILALHGAQSNNNVTRLQLSNLHITNEEYDIEYLQGGVEVNEAHSSLDGLIQGPFYSWFDKDDSASVIKAVRDVVSFCQSHGPFDGIYGFSSGAVVASLVANLPKDSELRDILTLHDHPNQVTTAQDDATMMSSGAHGMNRPSMPRNVFAGNVRMFNADHPTHLEQPLFKFVILACAAPDISSIREVAGYFQRGSGSILLPSFHIIGMEDDFKAKSEKNASLYVSGEVRYMPGGHGVPRDVSLDEGLCASLRTFARFLGRPPAPRSDRISKYVQMNKASSVQLLGDSQVVLVKLKREVLPEEKFRGGATIRGALAAQPSEKPLLYTSRNTNDKETTKYGDLLSFIDGGAGDLRALGVSPGEVVSYAAPPGGSALSAVAFLSIGAQTAAAPLAPGTAEPDALDALDQFDAKHLILFDGVECPGVEAAFEKYAAKGNAKIHRASARGSEKPGLFEYSINARTVKLQIFAKTPLMNAEDGTCLLLRTSGTTARPKGVPLTQGDLITNGAIIAHAMVRSHISMC